MENISMNKSKLHKCKNCVVPVTYGELTSLVFKEVFHINKAKIQQKNRQRILRVHRELQMAFKHEKHA